VVSHQRTYKPALLARTTHLVIPAEAGSGDPGPPSSRRPLRQNPPVLARTCLPALTLAAALCGAAPALAQVTLDLNALNALPNGTSEQPRSRSTPAVRHIRPLRPLPLPPEPPTTAATSPPVAETTPTPGPTPAKPVVTASRQPPAAAPPSTTPPANAPPATAPPAAVIPAGPPALPPPQTTTPAPPVAASSVPIQATVTFTPDQSTLSPEATQKLTSLGHEADGSATATINVLAYAPADQHDPSAARRMSLERALAVRNVLMAAGVPSARIYLRALGSEAGAGSPDRAEITLLGANLPATAQADTKGKQQ